MRFLWLLLGYYPLLLIHTSTDNAVRGELECIKSDYMAQAHVVSSWSYKVKGKSFLGIRSAR